MESFWTVPKGTKRFPKVWRGSDKFGQVQTSILPFGILNFFSVNDVVLANWLTRGAWDGNAVVCAIKSPSITYIALQWNANGSLKRLFSQSALWYGCNAKNILLPECILLPSDTKNRDGWNTQLFVSLMICWLWPGICVKYFFLFPQIKTVTRENWDKLSFYFSIF